MQLGPCISELKLPGRLLNHSEAIKLTQGSLTTTKIGPELVTEGARKYQVLGQGTNRLNQGHGSDGLGWGSQGSSARGEGLGTAQSR